jgi:hypothetical protein
MQITTAKEAEKLLAELSRIKDEPKLNELAEEIELTPIEQKLNDIRLKPDGRKLAGKKRAARNRARRKRIGKDRRYDARRKLRSWTAAAGGDWWPHVRRTWTKRSLKVKITEQQWKEHVAPSLPAGLLIVVNRYDTKGAISLDNIYITESGTSHVLWDGKEFKLKELGVIL